MATEKRFWMVWCLQGRAPTTKHLSQEKARQEAERLARANPGREFVVLQSLGTVRVRETEYVEHEWVKWEIEPGTLGGARYI
jgi:hypothetical protein